MKHVGREIKTSDKKCNKFFQGVGNLFRMKRLYSNCQVRNNLVYSQQYLTQFEP